MKIKVLLYFVVISILYLLVFSMSTSPLFPLHQGCDQDIFQIVGKYWSRGFLPYVDFWDQKGPLIFFIYAIGYYLFDARIGVFAIQIVCFSFTMCVTYKLFLEKFTENKSLILSSLFLLVILMNYDDGAGTEEFMLPLLMLSFYGIYKWSNDIDKIYTHKPIFAFIYGITFAFGFLTRLTNAIGVCMATLIIVCFLIYKGQWKNLMQNALAFIGGFLLLSIPFLFYFAINKSLDEMWYGTILYNLEYAKNSNTDYSIVGIIKLCFKYIDCLILLITSIVLLFKIKERRFQAILWLCVSSFTFIWLLKSNGFSHYGLICFPYMCIAFLEIYNLYKSSDSKLIKCTSKYSMAFILIIAICINLSRVKLYISFIKPDVEVSACKQMLKYVPINDRNYFIAYNCHPEIYLLNDIKPCYRFFVLQDFQTNIGGSLLPKLLSDFSTCKAKWILIKGAPNKTQINAILNTRYTLYKNNFSKLYLYKRNN